MPCLEITSKEEIAYRTEFTLDTELCFAIYKNSNKISRLYRSHLRPFNLTFPLYLTLIALWERSPCYVGEISQALDLETNTVTPLLKRLQSLGYVTRARDTSDERRVTIALTAQGQAMRDQAMTIRTTLIDRSGIVHQQASDLRAALDNLSKIIDELIVPEDPHGELSATGSDLD